MPPRIEVLFEYIENGYIFRGVKAAYNSGYRMEKKGINAKKFTPFMWTGGEQGLESYREKARAAKEGV